jgi:uncharacterized protein YndB with AHSA1/START domain
MASFSWTEPIVAPPEVVWEVLTDYPGYADLTPARRVELEREGTPPPNGVGAIRKIVAVGPPVREEITDFEPERKLVYKLLSGLPVKDHVGTITLEPAPGGTRMHYSVETYPAIPVIGHAAVRIVKLAVAGIVKGVVSESEKRAAAKATA